MRKARRILSLLIVLVALLSLILIPANAADSQTKSGYANGVLCYASLTFSYYNGNRCSIAATASASTVDVIYARASYTYRYNGTLIKTVYGRDVSNSNTTHAESIARADHSNAVNIGGAGAHSATKSGVTWSVNTSIPT